MESQTPSTGKFALTWGLIMGLTMAVFSGILYSMNLLLTQRTAASIIGFVVLVSGIVIGIYQFKKNNNGFLSIAQALKVGIGAALIAGVISVLFQLLLVYVIDPSILEQTEQISRKAMEDAGKYTTEQIEKGIEMQRKFYWVSYPIIIIFNLFLGLIISVIAGAIMKKSENNF